MVLRLQKDENLLCVVPSDDNNQHNTYCCTFTSTGVISSCPVFKTPGEHLRGQRQNNWFNESTLVFTWLVRTQAHLCLICLSFFLAKVVKEQIDYNMRTDNSCCWSSVKENMFEQVRGPWATCSFIRTRVTMTDYGHWFSQTEASCRYSECKCHNASSYFTPLR